MDDSMADSILLSKIFTGFIKYLQIFEESVKCPVCYEIRKGPLPMCVKGHTICQICRDNCTSIGNFVCPICKSSFSDIRNFVAEEVCSKIVDLQQRIYRLIRRCRLGSCQVQLPADCMYQHVRKVHRENLVEVATLQLLNVVPASRSCSKILCLKYDLNTFYDFALYAEELGLFFVNLHIDQKGSLMVHLEVASSTDEKNQKLTERTKLFFDMSLYVPGKQNPVVREGMIQECAVNTKKFFQPCKYDRLWFTCYFKNDMLTLDDRCTSPFTIALFIRQ